MRGWSRLRARHTHNGRVLGRTPKPLRAFAITPVGGTDEQSRSSRHGKDSKWGLAEVHSGGSGRTRAGRALCGMPCGHPLPDPEIEVEFESRRGVFHQACFNLWRDVVAPDFGHKSDDSGTRGFRCPCCTEREATTRPSIQGRTTHAGTILVVAITGLIVWKYRDSLSEYVKGNAGPAREKVDGLLQTVQQTSETLLDQAKEQISSRLEESSGRSERGRRRAGRGQL